MDTFKRRIGSIRHKRKPINRWLTSATIESNNSMPATTSEINENVNSVEFRSLQNATLNSNSLALSNEYSNYYKIADNFWDIDGYRIAIKRFENGHELGKSLKECIKERAKLEADYAKSLDSWQLSWSRYLAKESYEYGTSKQAWQAFLKTGTELAQIHAKLASNFEQPIKDVKIWIEKTYEKHIIHYLTTKKLEKDFESAQQVWKKCLNNIKELQKEYNSICKKLNATEIAVMKSQISKEQSEEQQATNNRDSQELKEALRLEKRGMDEQQHAESVKSIYENRMKEVFEETQKLEKERIERFKGIFNLCHDSLFNDLTSNDLNYKRIFEGYLNMVKNVNHDNDINWWSQHYAVGMPIVMPKFHKFNETMA